MRFHRRLSQLISRGGLLAVVTLGTAGLFKIAAFAREAFIASRFGLSSFTDAYFAFQQFPLILATFMFGAFGLAFTPAYASEKRKTGSVAWLPGVTVYGGAIGVLLTLIVTLLAPLFLRAFSIGNGAHGRVTLVILSCSFAPVIWLGIWAGTTLADGKNVLAMFVTGLPYLLMTALLVALYALGRLDALSLPISFLIGFAAIGLCALPYLVLASHPTGYMRAVIETWKMPGFWNFLRQLSASLVENLGYATNQLLLVYFVAQAGTGAVSANTCAMRVGMLGLSLLSLPLAQLLQAKLCAADETEQEAVLQKWLIAISGMVVTFAVLLYLFREPVTSLVYLHGKFSAIQLQRVTAVIPSWVAYFVVSSLNIVVARYLFAKAQGKSYVRRQLYAYAAANLIRVAFWGQMSAALVVWCSVFSEGCALLLNLRAAFARQGAQRRSPIWQRRRTVDALELFDDAKPTVVIHTPEPSSSAALYVEELSAALTEEKVPVRVVCPANHEARATMETNPLIDVRVCCERATSISVTLLTKLVDNLRFVASSCKALLNTTKPGDIVHFQYILHLPFGLIFFACVRSKRAHIVFTVHDPVPHKFLFPPVLRTIETGALRCAYKWSDVLIVHSEAGKRKLMEAFSISSTKIRVIAHGPYELKKKISACPESGRLEVLLFGSFRENKGLHLAIEATQQLAREGVALRLTIAGQVVNRKEDAYWQRCRKLIDSASTAICLKEGFVPNEKLADLFSSCHCFLLPYTTFSSDSGVAYMALANAKPIVSTDAGGLGWLLENSGGGIRIAEATVPGVIATLRQAVELGPDILERMGRAGAQWVSDECGWRKVARETREIYQEFIPQLKVQPISGETVEEPVELVGSLP